MISFDRVFREKRSLMLPLLIALAVNVALLVLAVLPLTQNVASEETRAVTAAADRAAAERAFARAEAIVNGKARADKELARFYGQVLPSDQTGARRIAYLNLQQLAKAAGLTVSQHNTPVPRETEDSTALTKYTTELTLSGSYRGIRQFIHAVETQPAFLVIESLDLASDGGEQPLAVTIKLATYFRAANGS
jgi:Tfp pilus assembly protein PilO